MLSESCWLIRIGTEGCTPSSFSKFTNHIVTLPPQERVGDWTAGPVPQENNIPLLAIKDVRKKHFLCHLPHSPALLQVPIQCDLQDYVSIQPHRMLIIPELHPLMLLRVFFPTLHLMKILIILPYLMKSSSSATHRAGLTSPSTMTLLLPFLTLCNSTCHSMFPYQSP